MFLLKLCTYMFIALVSENSAWGKNQWEFLFGSGFNVLSNFGISFGNPYDVCYFWTRSGLLTMHLHTILTDATSKNIPWRNPKNIPKPRGKMSTKNNYHTRHIYTLAAHATFGEVDKQTSRRLTSATCTTVHVIFYREIYI